MAIPWLLTTFGSALDTAEGASPVTTVTTTPIRRLRQSPYLSKERAWITFWKFQLEMETGVGLTLGQGKDPQVMLRWSDTRGKTWSHEHRASMGKIGRYKWRAIWRRLGRARDRIFQVTTSDAVPIAILDGLADVEAGRR